MIEDDVRKLTVIGINGVIERDRTSYGYQFRVDLEDDQYKTTEALQALEGKKVRVRLEIEQ